VLVLRRPAPVAPPVAPVASAASAQSFQEKLDRLEQPKPAGQGDSEVRMNSAEVNAALAQAAGLLSAGATGAAPPAPASGSAPAQPSGSMEFTGPVPGIKDPQVSMDGDLVRGQFLTQIAGKDVYLTLVGHLGAKDGYATFEATEVKLGDLSVPVALVNDTLQKKLAEQHDQLKLPGNVKDLKIENGELVFIEK
jgi:hypothetical protein